MRQKNNFDVNKLIQACETLTQSLEIFRGNPTTYSANRVERHPKIRNITLRGGR